jgi:hypothetical protein
MMNEEAIAQALSNAYPDNELLFQVIFDRPHLYIYVNRVANSTPNFEAITKTICSVVRAQHITDLEGIWIYSREMGIVDPDWEKYISLSSTQTPVVEVPQSETISPLSAENTEINTGSNLSRYCFTRNRSLLDAQLVAPSAKLSELIKFFHELSDDLKPPILDVLEEFFQIEPPKIDRFDPEIQQWFEQLFAWTQADESGIRKASIWFSRYCYNPEKTLAEIQAILDLEAIKAAVARGEYSEPVSTSSNLPSVADSRTQSEEPSSPPPKQLLKTSSLPSASWKSLILPIAWAIATCVVIVVAIISTNPSSSLVEICQNAKGSPQYCQLALQLVGDVTYEEMSDNLVPMTLEAEERASEFCEMRGNVSAGKTLKEAADEKIPVESSYGEEVLSGLYVVDVKQTSFKDKQSTVRTACVFGNTKKVPQLITADIIPTNWPAEAYKGKPRHESINRTLGAYNALITLGAGTLFTAIGMLIAALLGLGIRINSLTTLYKAAFVLGIIEFIISFIPIFGGIFIQIAVETIALLLTSLIIRGFRLDWAAGYRVVAAGAVTIIATRYLLGWLLFGAIAFFVSLK